MLNFQDSTSQVHIPSTWKSLNTKHSTDVQTDLQQSRTVIVQVGRTATREVRILIHMSDKRSKQTMTLKFKRKLT